MKKRLLTLFKKNYVPMNYLLKVHNKNTDYYNYLLRIKSAQETNTIVEDDYLSVSLGTNNSMVGFIVANFLYSFKTSNSIENQDPLFYTKLINTLNYCEFSLPADLVKVIKIRLINQIKLNHHTELTGNYKYSNEYILKFKGSVEENELMSLLAQVQTYDFKFDLTLLAL